jgi:formylmethanofuran--tetrahydromethanopterin N-formyltransferase
MSSSSLAVTALQLHGVEVVDTFAEAFGIKAARLIITAMNERWARIAAEKFCGYATSVIACDVEAAIERTLSESETPDGRPGVSILAFAFSRSALGKALPARVGQCILTCPTTACYDGLPGIARDKQIAIGGSLRFFGDGFQISKRIEQRRFWRIPVMDGEFLCEDRFGTMTGIAGGNLILCCTDNITGLMAAEAAVAAMASQPGIALPFPGGVVRSGSKVGSKYPQLRASTNEVYCPTLRPLCKSELPPGCGAVYEIVIDGLSDEAIRTAMKSGMHAAAGIPGLLRITAGNYGGKLGKHHFHLRDLL